MTKKTSLRIAIVHSSGKSQKSLEEKASRIQELEQEGFEVTNLEPSLQASHGITAAPILERAALLSHALTNRKFDIIMAARGGYGTTELIPFLRFMLPPVLPPKTLVGFSDISYLGVYLSCVFPNFRYIHARNAFSNELFIDENSEKTTLFNLLNNRESKSAFECSTSSSIQTPIVGVCIPLNLSLAESFAATQDVSLPKNTILFLEDCHEYVYRLMRKIDSLILSGFMDNVTAIVLGDFTKCLLQNEGEIEREKLLQLIADKTQKPIVDFPFFGHGKHCYPLVAQSEVKISPTQTSDKVTLELSNIMPERQSTQKLIHHSIEEENLQIHMCGIGGTGMASVAGLLKNAGYEVSGSDNKIYPPMDKVLEDLKIIPDVGFKKENISDRKIDTIIMGNVMSRKTSSLQKNEELEEILQKHIPIMSFPSALRKIFLNKSFNIIISGTHGKTTTSSLFAFLLSGLGENPSFLIGGMPGNFGQGFGLNSRNLFVLEGDEYDSAFFDKGAKFLHYEPSITLINNIEFDHADIYESVEHIEAEFLRLAQLTQRKNGFNLINWDDERVRRIGLTVKGQIIAFGSEQKKSLDKESCPFPIWLLQSFDTSSTGITLHIKAPDQSLHSVFCQQIFGAHNALNIVGVLAGLHAKYLLEGKILEDILQIIPKIQQTFSQFKGIKRRFELLGHKNEISIFEDFAHHPTAVKTTLEAFRDYMSLTQKKGRLIVCFDPHNATMRRNVLQNDLAKSFAAADMLFLGKIPQDLRMNQDEIMNGEQVIRACGIKGRYFDENKNLLGALQKEAKSYDTIVFMSSGSFDGIPHQFVNSLDREKEI